jgi:hypothetical protein
VAIWANTDQRVLKMDSSYKMVAVFIASNSKGLMMTLFVRNNDWCWQKLSCPVRRDWVQVVLWKGSIVPKVSRG